MARITNRGMSLDDLKNLKIETEEIAVVDSETGEEKVIKTVNRAEVVAIVAYMLGIADDTLEQYYSHHYSKLLEELRADRSATIIRYLSKIRTTIMKNFLNIDNEMRFNLTNLDRMEYFNKAEIDKLFSWGVYVVQPNYRSDKYIAHITKLMDENIDGCKKRFPENVKFEYIRSLFVVPKYTKNGVMADEYKKFKGNRQMYPFQMYMCWEPQECGNILYADNKFLKVLYEQHGEVFQEVNKFHDAADATKENIYNFIKSAGDVIFAVDCENCDPYKLYGVIKNLDKEGLEAVKKIILYDDYHTSIAWDYIGKMISIPIEHVEVPRVTDSKSLVDIQMAIGVSAAYYTQNVDSFILCSSDSDFWGLISALPQANFLVMYEYAKCGNAIKEALNSRAIFHCAMDDFYMQNAGDLQKVVLKKTLEKYLPTIIGENGWEITRQVYTDAYIDASVAEMRRFYEKHIKTLRLKMDEEGKFYVAHSE